MSSVSRLVHLDIEMEFNRMTMGKILNNILLFILFPDSSKMIAGMGEFCRIFPHDVMLALC